MPLHAAVVLDSWELFRLGVEQVLTSMNVRVAGSTSWGRESLEALHKASADVYIVGRTTDLKPHVALREAKKKEKSLQVLVLLEKAESSDVARLLSLGVNGLLLRSASVAELREALDRLDRGERVIAPVFAAGMLGRIGPNMDSTADRAADSVGLSAKELEVLGVLAEGGTYKEIAETLIVTQATIKTHLVHIYAKLGVKNREQAVARALSLGLLG